MFLITVSFDGAKLLLFIEMSKEKSGNLQTHKMLLISNV